ncbi:MAG: ankyrin repeat domain-containing protein [Candidatus Micrarchaeia archaeon]
MWRFKNKVSREQRDELRARALDFIDLAKSGTMLPKQLEESFMVYLPQAARAGDIWLVSLLMNSGAVKFSGACEKALLEALHSRDDKIVANILGRRPPLTKEALNSLLIIAAKNNAWKNIPMLVFTGASVDARTPTGDTALITALRAGAREAARTLILAGADVNAKGEKGTPLMHAAENAYYDLCDILISLGADPLAQVCGYRAIDCARDAKTFRLIDKWRTIRLLSQFREFDHSIS